VGVPTSRATEERARGHGIPLADLNEIRRLDVTIDGADEIDPSLDLIKGHGGALLWEKMVASASDRMVIVADDTKIVQRLGSRMSLPVEVIPFGWQTHERFLAGLGCRAGLRYRDGEPVVTDGGHYLLDCTFEGGMEDPARIATVLKARTGIVETGLFIGMATAAVVASAAGVRVVEREARG
jgi:ribose 5-phosphate isomerase A